MKKILFYICTFVFVSCTVDSKKLGSDSANYNTCLTETNVSDDVMLTVHDITHDRYKSESEEKLNKNGCVMQCLLQKAGLMEDAEYKVEKMHSEFIKKTGVQPGDQRLECLDTCINESKDLTEKCVKAFNLSACVIKFEHRHKHENDHEHDHEHENESAK